MNRKRWYLIDPTKPRRSALLSCRTRWEAEQVLAQLFARYGQALDVYCPEIHRGRR